MRVGERRIERHRLAEFIDRLSGRTLLAKHEPETIVRPRRRRIGADHLLERAPGIVKAAERNQAIDRGERPLDGPSVVARTLRREQGDEYEEDGGRGRILTNAPLVLAMCTAPTANANPKPQTADGRLPTAYMTLLHSRTGAGRA